jgi:hypothetical protein
MHLPTTTRIAALVLSLAALTGCPQQETGRFDFQDSWRGELTDQTYAVGASMDVVVYGPTGYDMNTTFARSIAGDDAAPVRLDRTEPYPEFGCIIASGEAEVPGDGRIAVADKFTRQPLDSVSVSTDTIDGIGLGRGINLWNGTLDTDIGSDLNVLSGGSLSFGVAPTNMDGEVLSGNLLVGASFTGGEVETWDSTIELWSPTDGILDLSLGDFTRQVEVATVDSDEVTGLQVEVLSMGTRGDMQEMQGENLLVVSGVTDDGRKVLGLNAEWTVDGWDYGVGDQMWSYGDTTGQVCWNDLCATF